MNEPLLSAFVGVMAGIIIGVCIRKDNHKMTKQRALAIVLDFVERWNKEQLLDIGKYLIEKKYEPLVADAAALLEKELEDETNKIA